MKHTYIISMTGVQFCGWPDGGCLNDQEYCVPQIFDIVLGEVMKDLADG